MSDPVKKESARKKSATKPAEKADPVKIDAEETAAAVKNKAPAKKTAAKKKTAEEVAPAAEEAEPVMKTTRGRKPKAAETPKAEMPEPEVKAAKATKAKAESTKAKTETKSVKAEAEISETKDVQSDEAPAPKRKYTKRKSADTEDASPSETEPEEKADASAAKKTTRKSKKAAEEVLPEDESADIEEKIYNLIRSSATGVYQSEIWKTMNIDSRKCSRILKKLLDLEKILREEAVVGGTKTYLLKKMTEGAKKNYDVLMVRDMFSPCTGCMGECRPEYCPALTFWIMNISDTPEAYYAAMGYNAQPEPEGETPEFPSEFIEEIEAKDNYEFAEEDDDLVFE